ncbi:hypothetical protein [Lysobacter gummosus]|uniref:hypothetical protein n=1 Tax=Lysobacter gummosus TaxID=262324 RepID=UPI00363C2DA7
MFCGAVKHRSNPPPAARRPSPTQSPCCSPFEKGGRGICFSLSRFSRQKQIPRRIQASWCFVQRRRQPLFKGGDLSKGRLSACDRVAPRQHNRHAATTAKMPRCRTPR